MKIKKLKEAIKKGLTLKWNDPDPIKGNDYTISFIEDLEAIEDGEDFTVLDWADIPVLIQYGGGSEAEVWISEISLK